MEFIKIKATNAIDATKEINKARLANKNTWLCFSGKINGFPFTGKMFNTWLQRFQINDLNHSNVMDQKPGDFKKHLLGSFAYYPPQKFYLLSPDGFTLTQDAKAYGTEKEAKKDFETWKNRFSAQGYYSSNKGRIPLNELWQNMRKSKNPY